MTTGSFKAAGSEPSQEVVRSDHGGLMKRWRGRRKIPFPYSTSVRLQQRAAVKTRRQLASFSNHWLPVWFKHPTATLLLLSWNHTVLFTLILKLKRNLEVSPRLRSPPTVASICKVAFALVGGSFSGLAADLIDEMS